MPSLNEWKPREVEILKLLSEGLSNKEIAGRIHISPDTVRWYNKRIFEKLDVQNRTQAVQRANATGLLGGTHPTHKEIEPPERGAKSLQPTPIRYIQNGDVHIAYLTIGAGPVDLLFIHGFLSHLELAWEEPEFKHFFQHLGQFARVILFDKRGVGLSDRIHGAPSIEQTIDDATSVLDAVDSEKTFVMGTSEGGAAAVLLASMLPRRVSGLVLFASTPKLVQSNGEPKWASTPAGFKSFIDHLQDQWGNAWALEAFAPSRAHEDAFRAWWSKVLRSASSPAGIRAVLEAIAEVDIRDLLPNVRVPALVLHKSGDQMVPVEAGRFLAEEIPDAVLIELPGEDHIYFVDSKAILAAIVRFLKEAPPRRTIDTWIAIVLCAATSDDGPPPVVIQSEVNRFSPRQTKIRYQNVFAVFESPNQALRCAQKLRAGRMFGGLRISLHIGECSFEDGLPTSAVMERSQEACEAAAPGEVLITQTLRDILAGMPLEFDEVIQSHTRLFSLQ